MLDVVGWGGFLSTIDAQGHIGHWEDVSSSESYRSLSVEVSRVLRIYRSALLNGKASLSATIVGSLAVGRTTHLRSFPLEVY